MDFKIPKPKDTRDGVFKRRFLCLMREIDTMSESFIQEMGIPTTGDLRYDKQRLLELVEVYITIDEMVEYMRKGISFSVLDYNETKVIYELIQDHLKEWQEEIRGAWSADHAPLDDLVDLDKLASLVYDKAKFVFNQGYYQQQRGYRGLSRFSQALGIGDLFIDPMAEKIEPNKNSENKDPHSHIPKRDSLEDVFLSRIR